MEHHLLQKRVLGATRGGSKKFPRLCFTQPWDQEGNTLNNQYVNMFKQLLQKVSRQFHYLHLALLKPSTEVGSENRNQTNLKKEFPRFQKSKVCAHAGKDKTKQGRWLLKLFYCSPEWENIKEQERVLQKIKVDPYSFLNGGNPRCDSCWDIWDSQVI